MPKKIFTDKEKEEIIQAYTIEKLGAKSLGAKYGCSAPTLLKNLKEWGIEANQKRLDLSKKVFNKLTVIKPAPRRDDKYTRWVCQCECGNEVEVRTDYLTSGHTTSCGCEKNKCFGRTVILNKLYGKLTPIEYNELKQQYLCKCECGNTAYIEGYNLMNGNTQSCGCLKSKGELKINAILTKMGINFKTQYYFNDCRFNDTNRLAYFDYAIFDINNKLLVLIEYDGEQHDFGWNYNHNSLTYIKEHDDYKNEYCKKNNIPLIRISYKDYNKLNEEYFKILLNNIKDNNE